MVELSLPRSHTFRMGSNNIGPSVERARISDACIGALAEFSARKPGIPEFVRAGCLSPIGMLPIVRVEAAPFRAATKSTLRFPPFAS